MLLPASESRILVDLRVSGVDLETPWRGRRDTTRRRLLALGALSVALHLGLTPWAALLGLWRWLPDPSVPTEPEEPVNAIPIDLLSDPAALPEPDPPPQPPLPPPDPKPPEPPPPEPKAAAPAELTPEAPRAPVAPPAPEPEKPVAEEPPAPDAAIADPVALSGSVAKLADSNVNVSLILYADAVRKHPLGARVGRILQSTPQWRDFFGPARMDPIRDIDRVLIAGPQLRDSSNVVAVVQHSLPDEAIEAGVDALVQRGGGEWIEGAKSKMARTRADRAERFIVLPSRGVVAIVPPSAEKAARALGKKTKFPKGPPGVALLAYIVTPWRALKGLPVQVPKSIEWVRIEVQPRADGGARARLILQDASEEEAKAHAEDIQSMIRAATELDFGKMGGGLGALGSLVFGNKKHKMLERVSLSAEGTQIRGIIEADAEQLTFLVDLVGGAADYYAQEAAERSASPRRGASEPPSTPTPSTPPVSTPTPSPSADPAPATNTDASSSAEDAQ